MDYDALDPYAGIDEDNVPLIEETEGIEIVPGVRLVDDDIVVFDKDVRLTAEQVVVLERKLAELRGDVLPDDPEPEQELSEEDMLLQGWHGGDRVLDYTHPVPTADQSGADFLPQWEAREKHLREHKW